MPFAPHSDHQGIKSGGVFKIANFVFRLKISDLMFMNYKAFKLVIYINCTLEYI